MNHIPQTTLTENDSTFYSTRTFPSSFPMILISFQWYIVVGCTPICNFFLSSFLLFPSAFIRLTLQDSPSHTLFCRNSPFQWGRGKAQFFTGGEGMVSILFQSAILSLLLTVSFPTSFPTTFWATFSSTFPSSASPKSRKLLELATTRVVNGETTVEHLSPLLWARTTEKLTRRKGTSYSFLLLRFQIWKSAFSFHLLKRKTFSGSCTLSKLPTCPTCQLIRSGLIFNFPRCGPPTIPHGVIAKL